MTTISPQQILVPKKVYIGDLAELQCSFNSSNKTLKDLTANGRNELPLVSFNSEDYDIKSISLSPSRVDFYQLTVTFIPWKTGELQFSPLVIEEAELILEFKPVQIVTLISSDPNSTTNLRETAGPLLLPGTAYKLYGSLAVFIVLLIAIIRIIVKRKSILFYLDTKRLQRKYRKNKKQTIRALQDIVKGKDCTEIDMSEHASQAEKIQQILRRYLEIRFDYSFTRSATSELMTGWNKATGGLLSDEKEEAFEAIVACFIRTDYIRYSKNAVFEKSELNELIQGLIIQIEKLEAIEKEETTNA